MTDPLIKVGHGPECARFERYVFEDPPCSGHPICDYEKAQALAANADATPWAARAKELQPKDPHGADYVAWEEWAERRFDRNCTENNCEDCDCYNCDVFKWWDNLDGLIKTAVYAAMAQIPGNAELVTLRRLSGEYLDAGRTRERACEEGWEEPEYRAAYRSVEVTGDALAAVLPKEKP